jgi:PTS system nitrogen regulatory IIA component
MEIDAESLAGHLRISLETLDRWIRQGRIPVRKNGNRCLFQKDILERWAVKHDMKLALDGTQDGHTSLQHDDTLFSAIRQGGGAVTLDGNTVETVLKNAVRHFSDFSESEKDELTDSLIQREKLASTGIGKGVAIPHPRNPIFADKKPSVLTCLLKNPLDFSAIDGIPVTILFVIVCTTVKTHLSILSQLSYCIKHMDFIDMARHVADHDQFLANVSDCQKKLDQMR